MCNYADNSYLTVPAFNAESCPAEIANAESWADNNNLKLNQIKSAEIVLVRPRSRVGGQSKLRQFLLWARRVRYSTRGDDY